MGKLLAEKGIKIDAVLSSDAARAEATAQRVAKAIQVPEDRLLIYPALYESDTKTIIDLIRSLDNRWESVMIVGHNPSISDTAVYLSGNERYEWMPTAAVLALQFDTAQWKEITKEKGRVIFYLTPRMGAETK